MTYDMLRVLALVVAWGIPAILVLGVVAFIIVAPALAFGGAARRLYEGVFGVMGRKTQREPDRTIGEVLAAAGLTLETETATDKTLAARKFMQLPVPEVDKVLARVGLKLQEEEAPRYCWEMMHCPPATREVCPTYTRRDLPRWVAIGLGAGGQVSEVCVNRALLNLKTLP